MGLSEGEVIPLASDSTLGDGRAIMGNSLNDTVRSNFTRLGGGEVWGGSSIIDGLREKG